MLLQKNQGRFLEILFNCTIQALGKNIWNPVKGDSTLEKEWIKGRKGENRQFKHEHLLNYVMNRWGLNKTFSVGATSELIRDCAPKNYEEWKRFYFAHAKQKKKDGIEITPTFLEDLGRKLFVKVSEVVQKEISSISEEECIDYVFHLVLGRTFEGYLTEVETVYGKLRGNPFPITNGSNKTRRTTKSSRKILGGKPSSFFPLAKKEKERSKTKRKL